MLDDVAIIDLYFGGGLPASQAFAAWKRIKKVYVERRKTVRAKRPVQQRKGKICPSCDGSGWVGPDGDMVTEQRCTGCGGTGKLSPVA